VSRPYTLSTAYSRYSLSDHLLSSFGEVCFRSSFLYLSKRLNLKIISKGLWVLLDITLYPENQTLSAWASLVSIKLLIYFVSKYST
jgi:hypothetical protein